MTLHELLLEISPSLNIDPSALSPDVTVTEITFGSSHPITLEKLRNREVVSLSALLCFVPNEQQLADLSKTLLEAHSFGYLTNDVVFALDRNASKMIMFKNLPLSVLTGDILLAELSVFKSVYETWKEAYDSGRLMSASTQEPSTAPAQGSEMNFA